MKLWVKKWILWAITPVAAVAGFACGFLAFALIDGMIAALIGLFPYLSFLRWISGAIFVYLTAVLSVRFAVHCAPNHRLKVLWVVLTTVLVLQGFQYVATALAAFCRQQWIALVNPTLSLLIVGYLFSKARRGSSALV